MKGKRKFAKVTDILIGSGDSAGAFFLGAGFVSFLVYFIGQRLDCQAGIVRWFFCFPPFSGSRLWLCCFLTVIIYEIMVHLYHFSRCCGDWDKSITILNFINQPKLQCLWSDRPDVDRFKWSKSHHVDWRSITFLIELYNSFSQHILYFLLQDETFFQRMGNHPMIGW